MARLPPAELARGVLTASAGNMAQGVAWCARRAGIPCTVVAPDTAPRTKLAAIERLGGRVIPVPFARWWETFETRTFPGSRRAPSSTPSTTCDVMAGNGTIGLEILEDLPDVDAVVIPWGGGGLFCGIAAAVRALRPACRLYAAEVATAAPLRPSCAAGAPQAVDYQPVVRGRHRQQDRLPPDAGAGAEPRSTAPSWPPWSRWPRRCGSWRSATA